MRRTFPILLALTLLAAACGDDDTAATTSAAPGSTEAPATTAAPTTTTTQPPTTTTEAPPEVPQVWVSHGDNGTVIRLDPANGEVLAVVEVGGRPGRMAAGSGSLWVIDCGSNSVHRIDPNAAEVTATITVGVFPFDIDVNDTVAAVVNVGDGTLSRIDTATNEVIATLEVEENPTGVAIGTYSVISSPGNLTRYDFEGNVLNGHDFGETSEDVFWHNDNLWAVHQQGGISSYDPETMDVNRYDFETPTWMASPVGNYIGVPEPENDTLWYGDPSMDHPFEPLATIDDVSAVDGTDFGAFAINGNGDVFAFEWEVTGDLDRPLVGGDFWIANVGPGADWVEAFDTSQLQFGINAEF